MGQQQQQQQQQFPQQQAQPQLQQQPFPQQQGPLPRPLQEAEGDPRSYNIPADPTTAQGVQAGTGEMQLVEAERERAADEATQLQEGLSALKTVMRTLLEGKPPGQVDRASAALK